MSDGSAYHWRLSIATMSHADWISAIGAVSHVSELDVNYYGNYGDLCHKFNGPPKGLYVLYFTIITQDWITPQESVLLYVSKFWHKMNHVDSNGLVYSNSIQRLFLETGTTLEFVLAHDNDSHELQKRNIWELITGDPTHAVIMAYQHADAKSWMFAFNITSQLRLDGTRATWKDGVIGNRDDIEWKEHKLLHAKATSKFSDYKSGNDRAGHERFRISVCRTIQRIELKVKVAPPGSGSTIRVSGPFVSPAPARTVGGASGTQAPAGSKFIAYLRSRMVNRYKPPPYPPRDIYEYGQPLWERESFAVFDPQLEMTIGLIDVPIGFAVLEVWAQDNYGHLLTEKKVMNVLVYPDVWCEHDGTRWYLRPPGPPGTFPQVPGGLWKRVDSYFIVDQPSDRYKPDKIRGYNYDDPNVSVDEAVKGWDSGGKKICCDPDEAAKPDPNWPGKPCVVPQYESEKVEVVVLERLQTAEPAEEVVPSEELGPQAIVANTGRRGWQ